MIKKFVIDICDILNIDVPMISYDTSHFQSQTMMAQCHSSGDVIHIKKFDKPNPDLFFAIAHELRHVWQIKNDEKLYLSDYQTVDKIGVEKYNLQPAEVDANAFASIIMADFFHLQPQYQGMSASVVSAIKKRMKDISI